MKIECSWPSTGVVFNVQFNIILRSGSESSKWSFCYKFWRKSCVHLSFSCMIICPAHPILLDLIKIVLPCQWDQMLPAASCSRTPLVCFPLEIRFYTHKKWKIAVLFILMFEFNWNRRERMEGRWSLPLTYFRIFQVSQALHVVPVCVVSRKSAFMKYEFNSSLKTGWSISLSCSENSSETVLLYLSKTFVKRGNEYWVLTFSFYYEMHIYFGTVLKFQEKYFWSSVSIFSP